MRVASVLCALTAFMSSIQGFAQVIDRQPQQQETLQHDRAAPQPTIALAAENALPQDAPPTPPPPEPKVTKPEFDIYGFAMLDMGYDFGQIDPDWFDVERPTKLPAFANEFGHNGNFYAGVRQSRFGVKSLVPTKLGQLKTVLEFEFFGVGVDAGQTTIRLRHAYGELGQFLAGQTWSPYMDPDVFPNSVEYWGPNGMVFFRNVQFRWQPINNENHVVIALERPGASGACGTGTRNTRKYFKVYNQYQPLGKTDA